MKNIFKHSALFLLLLLTTVVLLSTSLFFFKVSISKFHLITSFLICSIIYLFIVKKDYKLLLKIIGLSLLVIITSILIAIITFDRSSDGNTYHKDAVGVFKQGFNPAYDSSYDFVVKRDNSDELTDYAIWTDHYAKANWIMGANFYSLTNNIESGKAMNYVSMYILFVLLFTYLLSKMHWFKGLILSLIVTINPITASQLFTFYNDQLVCVYLFLGVYSLIRLDKDINDKEAWFIYILDFILIVNTKFNGLGYMMVFSFLFVLKYLFKAYKEKIFLPIFRKLCLIFIPLFIVSFVIVGYPTYIKNTIDHHNPFFPLYDDNGADIITAQEPKTFIKANNIYKLFYGTFSKANNLRYNDKTDIKIPFTIYKSEVKSAMSTDLRISGWGVWFSGLLILSIIIFIVKYKSYKEESYIIYSLGITVLLLLIMSESWWARYTPHFYLFIILSLYIMLKYNRNKVINTIYIAFISINTLIPLLGNSYYTLKNSIIINNDLNKLKNKTIVIDSRCDYNGIFYNLDDYHINYEFNDIDGKKMYYNYVEYKVKK